MLEYFVSEWGYDRAYASKALELLGKNGSLRPIKPMTSAIAKFVASHPDCNFSAFQTEMMTLLREVAEADGDLAEREELAIAAIGAALADAQ